MKAKDGMWFLIELLFPHGNMGKEQIETANIHLSEAIKLASEYEPSSAFKRAQQYFGRHCVDQIKVLQFAKGTRWLAIVRRDESVENF